MFHMFHMSCLELVLCACLCSFYCCCEFKHLNKDDGAVSNTGRLLLVLTGQPLELIVGQFMNGLREV